MQPHSIDSVVAHAFAGPFIVLILAVLVLSIVLKGFALWHSARNHQKAWFIVLLIVHTAGILDAIYLIFFRKDKPHITIATSPATPPASSAE